MDQSGDSVSICSGVKVEIFSILRGLRGEGQPTLLVSSELEEVNSKSDRLLVMRN